MANEEKMLIIKGEGNGCAPAIAQIKYYSPKGRPESMVCDDTNTELCKYDMARQRIRCELEGLQRELSGSNAPDNEYWIFSMQLLLIDDLIFTKEIKEVILNGHSASYAIRVCEKNFLEKISSESCGFLSSVANEVTDLASAISEALCDLEAPLSPSEYILFYPAPLPLHIARLRGELAGIVVPNGWGSGEIRALVRAMNIPLIMTDVEIEERSFSKKAIIDAEGGYLYIDPDMNALEKFSDRIHLANAEVELREKISKLSSVTKSGVRIPLLAELSESAEEEYPNPDGAALLKLTPKLLGKESGIDEDSLFYFYRRIAEANPISPLIVRSLSDRPFVRISKMDSGRNEENTDLYVIRDRTVPTQLRALLRASVYGNILFAAGFSGMPSELEELSLLISELCEELRLEDREASKLLTGAVIEDMHAAILYEDILDSCDFIVIETDTLLSQLKRLPTSESLDADEQSALCMRGLERVISSICERVEQNKKSIFFSFRNIPSRDELKIFLDRSRGSVIIPSKYVIDLKKMIIES